MLAFFRRFHSGQSISNCLLFGAALLFSKIVTAAPPAEVWPKWTVHQADDIRTLDHQPWTQFLQTYSRVGEDGIVRLSYRDIAPIHRQQLSKYLDHLQQTPISTYNRAEQFAFWINLYNALTVKIVLDHYPVASIRDITPPGYLSKGPWNAKWAKVEGEEMSLNDIEHRILRAIWKDPRIHYAVNCASLGCPDLIPTAFASSNTEDLLEEAARAFVNHPRGARMEGEKLIVSSLYIWYLTDWQDKMGLIEHLRHYADDELQEALAGFDGELTDEYDWRLNDAEY